MSGHFSSATFLISLWLCVLIADSFPRHRRFVLANTHEQNTNEMVEIDDSPIASRVLSARKATAETFANTHEDGANTHERHKEAELDNLSASRVQDRDEATNTHEVIEKEHANTHEINEKENANTHEENTHEK